MTADPRDAWARTNLARWGWAPGDYIGGKCLDCLMRLPPHAKRAWHCAPCAVAAEARAAEINARLDQEYRPNESRSEN